MEGNACTEILIHASNLHKKEREEKYTNKILG
jgi:hypothetical protein